MPYKTPKQFEIHTAEEWIRDYGAGSENYLHPTLNPTDVPKSLRSLIPFAERFGIPDDVTRNDFIDKQTDEALHEFCIVMEAHKPDFDAFLQSRPQDVRSWSVTAIHFLYLSAAYCEANGTLYVCRKFPKDVNPK